MFEIQSSQLALSKDPDADTKPFVEKMVADHQKTSAELKALVDGGKVKATLPAVLDSEHQKMLDELKGKDGKEFDRSYHQIQAKAHQDAVALFEAYSKNGDNADLRAGQRVDAWAAGQTDKPGRSEAIRRLVELGLAGSQPTKRRTPKAASKAIDLAGQQIDKLADPWATAEERQQRKRRLLKGPAEFRELRADLLKKKT
jgi:hypothetical protein